MQMENSLADLVLEVGYGCTQNAEECRNTLIQFGVREITPMSIARVLGMMARTPSGVTDQISVQVSFIQCCHTSGKNQRKQNFLQIKEFWKVSGYFGHLTDVREFCQDNIFFF